MKYAKLLIKTYKKIRYDKLNFSASQEKDKKEKTNNTTVPETLVHSIIMYIH